MTASPPLPLTSIPKTLGSHHWWFEFGCLGGPFRRREMKKFLKSMKKWENSKRTEDFLFVHIFTISMKWNAQDHRRNFSSIFIYKLVGGINYLIFLSFPWSLRRSENAIFGASRRYYWAGLNPISYLPYPSLVQIRATWHYFIKQKLIFQGKCRCQILHICVDTMVQWSLYCLTGTKVKMQYKKLPARSKNFSRKMTQKDSEAFQIFRWKLKRNWCSIQLK